MSVVFRFKPSNKVLAETTESFAGKTVLITGTSGALGLEAAKKLASLNADKIIITTRNESKANAVKAAITSHLESRQQADPKTPPSPTEIIPLTLSMSSLADIQSFITDLKSTTTHLDHAILNAGTMARTHTLSAIQYESTIQVNTVSTTLLGLLLLPFLIASPYATEQTPPASRPHLSFISSGTAWLMHPSSPEIRPVIPTTAQQDYDPNKPIATLSTSTNFPKGYMGGAQQYAVSKLLLEYGMRRIAALPHLQNPDGSPKVIVHSVCPGVCTSDLGRSYNTNFVINFVLRISYAMIARPAEMGAREYISGLTQGTAVHGQMWTEDSVSSGNEMVTGDEGKGLEKRVWNELVGGFLKTEPSLSQVLGPA